MSVTARRGRDISPLIRKLASYIAGAPRRALPRVVAERAKLHLLDTLAAMISGSRLLPGRRAISFAAAQGGAREACVIGSRIVTSAVNAALANGMHGHSDETDDTYYLALVHPGCSIVPAALAMAERERAGGTALLRAMVLGYDLCARVSQALGLERFRSRGHSTHSFGGIFGSAAAAGALARLDADRVRYLLSYAAQQASGLSCWARDTEHIEKAFHFGGMPARNGVTAAIMVGMRFTAVEDVFSGDRSFFHAFGATAEPQRLVEGLGREFELMNTAIKRWPVGYPIQAPLDAVSNLVAAHGVRAADVERLVVTIDEQGARTVNRRKMASINIQHLVAMMLIDGEITFETAHDEARVRDPRIVRLKRRIELAGSATLSRAKTTQAIVELVTRDGRRLRHHTRAVRGTAANPMSRDEVAAKSRDLLLPVIGARRTQQLIDTVWRIERVGDVRQLRPLLQV
ncbi:MAG: MmgE/PrpD family protein [Betaproteobacteria bacterium]|nr:MmgE/PrpD family protein [Betaproteobacteria bacterium]MDH3437782.1 MmgE/PrpD family protein [Betaproteobacteria bacterium]